MEACKQNIIHVCAKKSKNRIDLMDEFKKSNPDRHQSVKKWQYNEPKCNKTHEEPNLNRLMGKPTICIYETEGADQLRSNCEADQRHCFRYSDSTIPPLLNFKISSF